MGEGHPGMRIIVPHGGGALPLLADRIKAFLLVSALQGPATFRSWLGLVSVLDQSLWSGRLTYALLCFRRSRPDSMPLKR
jgi:hypothetical protein